MILMTYDMNLVQFQSIASCSSSRLPQISWFRVVHTPLLNSSLSHVKAQLLKNEQYNTVDKWFRVAHDTQASIDEGVWEV